MGGFNLADVFETVVDAVGAREALVSAAGERWSFEQLDRRTNQLAHAFADRGIRAGDRVGIQLRNHPTYLESMLATFKLRAIPINVHYRYTVDELSYLLGDATPTLVIHEPDLAADVTAAIDGLGSPVATLEHGVEYESAIAASPVTRLDIGNRTGDDHYIIYTGGTTGRPKGVIWRHEDLFLGALSGGNPGGDPPRDLSEVAVTAKSGRTRCLPASPFTHGTAHWTALATLFGGGTVIVSDPGPLRPDRLWSQVQRESASLLIVVGDAFVLPLVNALDQEPDRWDLSDLLTVVSGGAVLSPSVRSGLLKHVPWAVVVDGYGTSETGGQGQMAAWAGRADAGRARFEMSSDTAVFDDEQQRVVPGGGVVGQLGRRGHIPLGYRNDPDRTAAVFPTIDGERWALPGDFAVLEADGQVTLLGRGASSINTGGEKVFPEEVEATLKGHSHVFDAMVVGTLDDRWGEVVSAVVQLRRDAAVDPAALRAHCLRYLAPFKAPRLICFVPTVLRRPSGKPDYEWARRLVMASTESSAGADAPHRLD